MRNKNIRIIMILVMLVLGAINFLAGPRPPLDVVWRDSYIGIGKVLLITNISEKRLNLMEVSVRSPNGRKLDVVLATSLGPGETKSVGWNELYDGETMWVPKAGDIFKIYCIGYRKPLIKRITMT